jgi:hypothetical protein
MSHFQVSSNGCFTYRPLTISTGKLARFADGASVAQVGIVYSSLLEFIKFIKFLEILAAV